MTLLVLVLLFPLAVLAQSTLLWGVLPGGVTPDLALLMTVACGLGWGAAGGTAAGLWAGVLVGALRGWAGLPLAVVYGLVGWLAGLHREKGAARWTYPLAGLSLVVLLTALEAALSQMLAGGSPPDPTWTLATLGWHALACVALLGVRR